MNTALENVVEPIPTQEQLCQDISNIISRYKNNVYGEYDVNHVSRWVAQFDESERQIVLEETKLILQKGYLPETTFDLFITNLYQYLLRQGMQWNQISFLSIQGNGNSQASMLRKLTQHVLRTSQIPTIINNMQKNIFVYLDDFIFSGNRIIQDIKTWLINNAPISSILYIASIGYYSQAKGYIETKIREIALSLGKQVTINFVYNNNTFIKKNRLNEKNTSDVFWPMVSSAELHCVSNYLSNQSRPFNYRVATTDASTTFSPQRREQYENIILKYGLYIINLSQQPSPTLKPLGFSLLEGLGFGSTIFTYRNCPNNCPLVFWWGDHLAPRYLPISRWYPLLQRDTYNRP